MDPMFRNTMLSAMAGFKEARTSAVTEAFRTLLQEKHLYQSVKIDDVAVLKAYLPRVESKLHESVTKESVKSPIAKSAWALGTDPSRLVGHFGEQELVFTPPDVKLYCKTCSRREAFNLASASGVHNSDADGTEEVYVLAYQCQACKRPPEVILVQRAKGRITLSGRAPMEHVEIPAGIPKEIAKYYSDAVLAFQSGQTLAALFMLRTACEQWARKWGAPEDRADVTMAKYMASLPPDFKDRFPSLQDIYTQLSADLHAATGSAELFIKELDRLTEHCDARRLFKLTVSASPTPTEPVAKGAT